MTTNPAAGPGGPRLTAVPATVPTAGDGHHAAMARHPSSLCRHLDEYLEAVARELRSRGVLACPPRRSDPARRLFGSIVLDCTAPLVDDGTGDGGGIPGGDVPGGGTSPACAPHPGRLTPVVATWDEDHGWCVGLRLDAHSARRYLSTVLFPASHEVADFVVGLALGHPLGSEEPPTPSDPDPGPRHLRAV
ncbi:hypothetical protein EV383_3718 [Pseudonocardia sediminis]|uniref:Uncharacterized protein n=1 Tax=Pseudonocardia sediminis TaxID=1397368 RepID=A0A4Q7V2M0_PSEST|nr:hypothetical protein [Pseudonocardia sediminis]RZT86819.1 hypothetical protein EV383_3718 [Pseudonocardia sediminis]